MNVTFLVPSTKRTIGGVISVYEFANGLRRRGHRVHLVHLPVVNGHIEALADLAWFTFEPGIEHEIVRSFDQLQIPGADFVELTALRFFEGPWSGDAERRVGPAAGLPFLFVQAYRFLPPAIEARALQTPCPKICIATWMRDALRDDGAVGRLTYIPYGLDRSAFRLVNPIAGRPAQISMLYNGHPAKGARYGLAAIAEAQRRLPGTRAVVFGNQPPVDEIPAGIDYVQSPSRRTLVEEIYNASRVFVCSSVIEGFGLCAIEAMAGGCALVTTANGGSADYAIAGENALVCAPRDVDGLADRIERLLRDDDLRVRLATRGPRARAAFRLGRDARRLEEFLEQYALDPVGFQTGRGEIV